MALGRQGERQSDLMVGWAELPRSPGHAFYDRLQAVLIEAGFDGFAESQGGIKWSLQHHGGGVAMKARQRRSDRGLRGVLRSPGRPGVARREDRRRFWAAIALGLASEEAAA